MGDTDYAILDLNVAEALRLAGNKQIYLSIVSIKYNLVHEGLNFDSVAF